MIRKLDVMKLYRLLNAFYGEEKVSAKTKSSIQKLISEGDTESLREVLTKMNASTIVGQTLKSRMLDVLG